MTDWSSLARTETWRTDSFPFESGQVRDLALGFRTLGTPRREGDSPVINAALLLHGTTGTAEQFLKSAFADPLFGPGCPLDAERWFLIIPDGIGAGRSSKPSDGEPGAFPRYGYRDQVEAQRRLVAHFGVERLRVVLGTSMGGMQTWLWAGLHPDHLDAAIPIACQPAAISGRNLLWREMILRALGRWRRHRDAEPVWTEVWPLFALMTENARALGTECVDRAATEVFLDTREQEARNRDPDDTYATLDSSYDYDPAPLLARIRCRLTAISFADDLLNPLELGVTDRAVAAIPSAEHVVIAASNRSRGHQTQQVAQLWAAAVARALEGLQP